MNIVLFFVSFILFVLFIAYIRLNKNLKYEYTKLQADLSRLRNEQESFSIEIEKSNAELTAKPTDSLTGLPERAAFEERLRQAIRQSKRYSTAFALLSLDIDDFSQIDQGAPRTREELLVQIAQRILSVIRGADSLTRFAGSQFVLLLPHVSQPTSAGYVATRIQEAMLEPFIVDTKEFHLTASLGIAVYPMDGDGIETLLQKSAAALNKAKRVGKNKYHFWHHEIHTMSSRESQLFIALRSSDLLTALKINYTPQVLTHAEQMTGIHAEAIMLHSTLGQIKSRELIRMAEHSGHVTEIMTWLFREAITKAAQYHKRGDEPLRLALSVSSHQIENAHFIFQMAQIAGTTDPRVLQPVFELSDPPTRTLSSLFCQGISTLSAANVHFAVYLSVLGQNLTEKFPELQFIYLKADITMIEGMMEKSEGGSIASPLSALTKNTSSETIIEGVENTGQLETLQNMGFRTLEGPFFKHFLTEKREGAESP